MTIVTICTTIKAEYYTAIRNYREKMLQKQFNKLITYSSAIAPQPTILYK
ncbi:hypothetical protein [Microcoleus sp. B4-C1]